MLEIGPDPSDDESLLAFVDRLGAAGSDRAAARAHEQVRRAVAARVPVPGLRGLATSLEAVGTDTLPPPPRRPADEPGQLVAAVRENPLLILDDVDAAEVAGASRHWWATGRRVIVTASDSRAQPRSAAAAVGRRRGSSMRCPRRSVTCRLRGLPPRRRPPAGLGRAQPDLGACPAVAEVAQPHHRGPGGSARHRAIADVLGELTRSGAARYGDRAVCAARAHGARAHPEPWHGSCSGTSCTAGAGPSSTARATTAQALAAIGDGRGTAGTATGPLPRDRWMRSSPT
jgi:hypothetical protein